VLLSIVKAEIVFGAAMVLYVYRNLPLGSTITRQLNKPLPVAFEKGEPIMLVNDPSLGVTV
jgi:hypothetical protein